MTTPPFITSTPRQTPSEIEQVITLHGAEMALRLNRLAKAARHAWAKANDAEEQWAFEGNTGSVSLRTRKRYAMWERRRCAAVNRIDKIWTALGIGGPGYEAIIRQTIAAKRKGLL